MHAAIAQRIGLPVVRHYTPLTHARHFTRVFCPQTVARVGDFIDQAIQRNGQQLKPQDILFGGDMDHTFAQYHKKFSTRIKQSVNWMLSQGAVFGCFTSDDISSVDVHLARPLDAQHPWLAFPGSAHAAWEVQPGPRLRHLSTQAKISMTQRRLFVDILSDAINQLTQDSFVLSPEMGTSSQFRRQNFRLHFQDRPVNFSVEVGPGNMAVNLQGPSITHAHGRLFILELQTLVVSNATSCSDLGQLDFKNGRTYLEYLTGTKHAAWEPLMALRSQTQRYHFRTAILCGDSENDTDLLRPRPGAVPDDVEVWGAFVGSKDDYRRLNPNRSERLLHVPLINGDPSYTQGTTLVSELLATRLGRPG